MQSNNTQPTKFLRIPQIREICGGVSNSTIWSWVKNSDKTGFPRTIKLSANCTVFSAQEIEAWAKTRIAASRAQPAGKA